MGSTQKTATLNLHSYFRLSAVEGKTRE